MTKRKILNKLVQNEGNLVSKNNIEALETDGDVLPGSPAENVVHAVNPVLSAMNEFILDHLAEVMSCVDDSEFDCVKEQSLAALKAFRTAALVVDKAIMQNLIYFSDLPHHIASSGPETRQA